MLIGFSVGNHRSFKEIATLSLIDESGKPGDKALLFGANDSGKTNFLRAIEAMSSMVRFGLICYLPFNANKSTDEPSFFEVSLLAGSGDQIQYGFEVGRNSVDREWLYRFDHSGTMDTAIVLFERDHLEVTIGNTESRLNLDASQSGSLFLDKMLTFEAEIVREFFSSIYVTLLASKRHLDGDVLSFVGNDCALKSRLSKLMSAIDLPIPDPVLRLPNSRGFDEAFGFLSLLLFAESRKIKLLCIDNFGESLHPLLASKLLNIASSTTGLQLIFSTHQTRLMDEVSPYAIWLVEKNTEKASNLTGIVEYKYIREGSLSVKYLSGIRGGVPFVDIIC